MNEPEINAASGGRGGRGEEGRLFHNWTSIRPPSRVYSRDAHRFKNRASDRSATAFPSYIKRKSIAFLPFLFFLFCKYLFYFSFFFYSTNNLLVQVTVFEENERGGYKIVDHRKLQLQRTDPNKKYNRACCLNNNYQNRSTRFFSLFFFFHSTNNCIFW